MVIDEGFGMRPSKFTPEARAAIIEAIAEGNTRAVAAACAGVDVSTFYRWMAEGEEALTGQRREFFEAVKKAEADAIAAMVAIIRKAAPTSWQAAAWWLERKYPDEWGRKDRVAIEDLLRREAERMADDLGLDAADIIADTQRILARSS